MFKQRLSSTAWVACVPQASRLQLALVEAGDKPAVRWLHSDAAKPSAASLRRARRALPRGRWASVALLERGQYQLLQTEAPEMPPEEWRDALRWRLKDQLDFLVDGAALDLLTMPPEAGPRNQRTLVAVAAPAGSRDQLRRDGEDAGWDWQALDVAETALRNLSRLLASPNRGHALLHVGDAHATLVITVAGGLLMSRQVDVGLAALTDAEEGARQQALERVGLELQRTLDNFDRVFSQVSLERLDVLPGPGAGSVADFVRELVYVPVLVANPHDKLDLSALPPDADLSGHWLAIGAALRQPAGMAAAIPDLNLDPPARRPRPQPWRASQGLAAAAVALASAWALGMGLDAWAQRRAAEAQTLAQTLPQQRAALERDPGSAEAIARLAAERDRLRALEAGQRQLRAQIDEHLLRAATGYTPYFSALSRQGQGSVWITGFSVAPDQGAIEIQGRMQDAAALPGYLQRLNQEASFKGRRFGRLQLAQGEGHTAFTLAGSAAEGTQGAVR